MILIANMEKAKYCCECKFKTSIYKYLGENDIAFNKCLLTDKEIQVDLNTGIDPMCPVVDINITINDMRDPTPQERASVNDYIESISTPTGVNFWDEVNKNGGNK